MIFEFIKEWASSILLLLTVITLVFGLLSGFFKNLRHNWSWKQTVDSELKRQENELDDLEKRFGRFEEKIDRLTELMISSFNDRRIIQSTSPLTLTDYGEELAEKANAEIIAERYAGQLFKEIENLNEYQIQEFCFDFTKQKLLEDLKTNDHEDFEVISRLAFNEGIEIDKVTRVIGLVLRDQLIKMKYKKGPTSSD